MSARTPVKSTDVRRASIVSGTAASPRIPATPQKGNMSHHRPSITSFGSPQASSSSNAGASPRPASTTTPRPAGAATPTSATYKDPNNCTMNMTTKTMGTTFSGTTTTSSASGGENVRVYVRLRDFSVKEKENFIPSDLAVRMSGPTCEVTVPGRGKFPFTFDECFWSNSMEEENKPYADQEDLYEVVGAPLVSNVLAGFNSSIIAYGQTGSGKTYSIFGPAVDNEGSKKGLIPRVCDGIFASLQHDKDNGINLSTKFTVSVTMLEVYLEEVFDLLNQRKKLAVRQDSPTSFGVVGAKSFDVTSYTEVLKLIEKGDSCKTFAATAMNERSSRAHTLFQLVVSAVSPTGSRSAKVMLADLAGCERIKVSKTESGTALDEACNINLSLLTLGTCIEAAVARSKQGRGIDGMGEFRQSTLTKLLKDFIGGNSRTAMLVAIAPALKDVNLTLQALRFADRAKQIQTHAKINYTASKNGGGKGVSDEALKSLYDSKKELLDKEYQLEKAQQELAQRQEDVALAQIRLDEERKAIAERCKLSETSEEEKKMLQARVNDIESTMKSLSQELIDMEREKDLMREKILAVCQDNAAIVSDKEALERKVAELQAVILELETERSEEMQLLEDQKNALEKDLEVMEERLRAREAYLIRTGKEEKTAYETAMVQIRNCYEEEKQEAIEEWRAKYSTLESTLNASRQQCFTLTANLEKSNKAFEEFKAATEAKEKEIADTHAHAVSVLTSHFNAEIEKLQAQIKDFEAKLASEQTAKAAVEKDLAEMTVAHEALKTTTDAKIATLEADFAKIVADNEAATEALMSEKHAIEDEKAAASEALAFTIEHTDRFWSATTEAVFGTIGAKDTAVMTAVADTFNADSTEKQFFLAELSAANALKVSGLAKTIADNTEVMEKNNATIRDRDAEIETFKDKLTASEGTIADWEKRFAALEAAMADAKRDAEESAEITEAEHQVMLEQLKKVHAEAVASFEDKIATATEALRTAEDLIESNRIASDEKMAEMTEARAKEVAEMEAEHKEAVMALEESLAEKASLYAAEADKNSSLADQLAFERATVADKMATIEGLKLELSEREARMRAAALEHEREMDAMCAQHQAAFNDLKLAHKKDLGTLKTTALTTVQQQHHHAKMLATEAHQAQFMIQQALARFNAAVSANGPHSMDTVFSNINGANVNVELASPYRTPRPTCEIANNNNNATTLLNSSIRSLNGTFNGNENVGSNSSNNENAFTNNGVKASPLKARRGVSFSGVNSDGSISPASTTSSLSDRNTNLVQ